MIMTLIFFSPTESTLTRYHHHNPPVEQCRDRYVHVPKFVPREDTLIPHEGLEHLKKVNLLI
jgi:hypothetical protein